MQYKINSYTLIKNIMMLKQNSNVMLGLMMFSVLLKRHRTSKATSLLRVKQTVLHERL